MNLRSDFTTIKSSDIFTNCRIAESVPRLCTHLQLGISKLDVLSKSKIPYIYFSHMAEGRWTMKSEEHQFKLAKIAIKKIIRVLALLAALWMVLQHNPIKLVTSINLEEQSIDFNCEFASETPEK